MPTHVLSAAGVVPSHRYTQSEITEQLLRTLGPGADAPLTRRLHANAGVRTRHTVLALERYATLTDFGAANDEFIAAAVTLGCEAIVEATSAVGVGLADVDVVISATVTGRDSFQRLGTCAGSLTGRRRRSVVRSFPTHQRATSSCAATPHADQPALGKRAQTTA